MTENVPPDAADPSGARKRQYERHSCRLRLRCRRFKAVGLYAADEKYVSAIRAKVRSLAQKNGYPPKIAAAMMMTPSSDYDGQIILLYHQVLITTYTPVGLIFQNAALPLLH